KRVRKAGDKVRAQIKAEDTTNPTFPCGHSARSDGGNILPWRDKWLCLLCTTKKDVARRRADIKWLRNNEAKARARYGSLNQIESQIKRHEEKIAVHEAYLARIEGVTTTTTNHAELLTNDEA